MAQQFQECTALPEAPSSVLSTTSDCLQLSITPAPRGSDALFCLHRTDLLLTIVIYMAVHTHRIKYIFPSHPLPLLTS